MSNIAEFENLIRVMLNDGKTYEEISISLRQSGVHRGSSVANVRKYCTDLGINRRAGALTTDQLCTAVSSAIDQVGPTYGRKMMYGLLSSSGIHAGVRRIGSALKVVNPRDAADRLQRVRNGNSIPYHSAYFGNKLHMDQNEKLAMFGVMHVVAVDGFSSKIVGWNTMPAKNNLTIYELVYRPAVLRYGCWDTVRVDHGTEFFLCLYMQEKNSTKRRDCTKSPFIQSASKENMRVERIWPEVNNRVNYPLKAALVDMVNSNDIDFSNSIHRFCVSNLTQQVSTVGLSRFVAAWNSHTVAGRGVPDAVAVTPGPIVDENDFPTADIASSMYEEEFHRRLSNATTFAPNPFPTADDQRHCDGQFCVKFPDLSVLMNSAANQNPKPFKDAVKYLISITEACCK